MLQKGRQTLNCSHSESSPYNFFWYRQLPGKKELQHIGSLFEYNEKLTESEEWLSGNWLEKGKRMSLELQGPQPSDTGLYLCAVRDTVKQAGTAAGAKPSASIKQPQLLPRAAGTLPISHKCSLTSHNQWAYWCHHLHQGHTAQGAVQRNSPDVRCAQHYFPQSVYTDAIICTRVPQPGTLQTLF
ncbi:T-cell receptor alpha chain V region 2B4 [Podarcis lilfordi]|nr:T-cell receptor alpha chain V region 2B4 [Podarcis lilfordi]